MSSRGEVSNIVYRVVVKYRRVRLRIGKVQLCDVVVRRGCVMVRYRDAL